jgi:hypothetical protein
MNRSARLVCAFAVTLLFATVAVAQHGRPAGAGGGGVGVGHSTTGMSHSTQPSMPGAKAPTLHSSTSVLNNQHTMTALSNALSNAHVPIPGNDLKSACSGFKSLGQCVAALHVSKNLGVSFTCLKDDMIGQAATQGDGCPTGTGSSKMSIGKAITALQPAVNAKSEAKKANKQASDDLNAAESSS